MVKHINIKKCHITLALRHRFEKQKHLDRTFNRWELGIWFKKDKIVGTNNFKTPEKWGASLVNSYMLGIEVLFFRTWINIDFGGMHLGIYNHIKKH